MKKTFYITTLFLLVLSTICFAQNKTILTPDMVRHQLNGQRQVKEFSENICTESGSYDFYEDGSEDLANHYYHFLFDRKKRLTYRMVQFGGLFGHVYQMDTILYNDDSYRPMLVRSNFSDDINIITVGTKIDKKFIEYRRYFYSGNAVEPYAYLQISNYQGKILECKYCEINYTEFDQYGNWTKAEATLYESRKIKKDWIYKLQNLTLSNDERSQLEAQIIEILKKQKDTEKLKNYRTIKYY